jgi:hypothetical protein
VDTLKHARTRTHSLSLSLNASYAALFREMVAQAQLPSAAHYALWHRLRLAAAVSTRASRLPWDRVRVLAIAVLGAGLSPLHTPCWPFTQPSLSLSLGQFAVLSTVSFGREDAALKSFFLLEPEITTELAGLLTATPAADWVRPLPPRPPPSSPPAPIPPTTANAYRLP